MTTSSEELLPLRTEWHSTMDGIARLRDAWIALEQRVEDRTILCSFDFILPWYRHLGTHRGRPLVVSQWRGDDLVGAVPLLAWSGSLGRVPVRRLDLPGHEWQSGECLFLDRDVALARNLVIELDSRRGFDVACLNGFLESSSHLSSAERAAADCGLPSTRLPCPYAVVDLSRGYDGYTSSMSSNFRHNLRRQHDRIRATATVGLDRIRHGENPEGLQQLLDRAFAIYDRSWKARQSGPLQEGSRRFLSEALHGFGARRMLDLAVLRFDDRDTAFLAGVVERRRYYDFTASYDASFESLSPGTFLLQEIFRALAEEGVDTVVSHGGHEYKRRWATRFEPQVQLLLFRRTLPARLSRLSKFRIEPWLRLRSGRRPAS